LGCLREMARRQRASLFPLVGRGPGNLILRQQWAWLFFFLSFQETKAKEFFIMPWVTRAECDNGRLEPTWRLSNLVSWLRGWWISGREVKGMGQIGFFSCFLAILVFNFLMESVSVQQTSGLYSKNKYSLGKERVVGVQEGQWVLNQSTLVLRCLFHWYMLNFALDLPLTKLVYGRMLKCTQAPCYSIDTLFQLCPWVSHSLWKCAVCSCELCRANIAVGRRWILLTSSIISTAVIHVCFCWWALYCRYGWVNGVSWLVRTYRWCPLLEANPCSVMLRRASPVTF